MRRTPAIVAALLGVALSAAGCGSEETPPPRPPPRSEPTSGWDLARLPALGPTLRQWATPTDVRVLVVREGKADEALPLAGMDVLLQGYLRDGQRFMEGPVALDRPGGTPSEALIPGLRAGLEGLLPGERRRVLVPAAEAFLGETPSPTLPRGADLVFDVTRARWAQRDLEVGGGEVVKAGHTVRVHYRGTLEDGSVFDDSRVNNKGEPLSLTIQRPERDKSGVIEGWYRGIPGMRVGGRRLLEVPAVWGYGSRGYGGGKVPPHAHLRFVVEIAAIER